MLTIIRFLHLLSLVVWMGGIMFFSFIAAPSIFKVLPRETAGDVVGDIFPKYWMMGYICSITALATLILLSYLERTFSWVMIGILVLMAGLAFYSGLAVGSKARDIKAEIRVTHEQAQKETLKVNFKSLHKKSAILNIIILSLGLTVIFITTYKYRI